MAHKFSVSANHFAYLAVNGNSKLIVLNFLTGEITPKEYLITRNSILLEQCKVNFEHLTSEKEKQEIVSAILTVTFSELNSKSTVLGNYEFIVKLARGKTAIGIVNSGTMPQA